jgi:Cu-Zn family superoxide dismutase
VATPGLQGEAGAAGINQAILSDPEVMAAQAELDQIDNAVRIGNLGAIAGILNFGAKDNVNKEAAAQKAAAARQAAADKVAAAKAKAAAAGVLNLALKSNAGVTLAQARITPNGAGVDIRVQALNLTPGLHGFHIHAVGKCDGPDFATAGAHFNPGGTMAGDLPGLPVGTNGKGEANFFVGGATLAPGLVNSLRGTATGTSLVIHADAGSGPRIACAVIGAGTGPFPAPVAAAPVAYVPPVAGVPVTILPAQLPVAVAGIPAVAPVAAAVPVAAIPVAPAAAAVAPIANPVAGGAAVIPGAVKGAVATPKTGAPMPLVEGFALMMFGLSMLLIARRNAANGRRTTWDHWSSEHWGV